MILKICKKVKRIPEINEKFGLWEKQVLMQNKIWSEYSAEVKNTCKKWSKFSNFAKIGENMKMKANGLVRAGR